MAKLIDGKKIAAEIAADVKKEIARLGISPGLAVVLVGDDPASHLYVRLKEKACRDAGISFEKFFFRSDAGQEMVVRAIRNLNARPDIDGILVQLPLPEPFDKETIIDAVDPEKDVDGFHPRTVARYLAGQPIIVPGLVAGIMALVGSTGVPLVGTRSLVASNSEAFYAPLRKALEDAGSRPSFVFANDRGLGALAKDADLLIVAAGRPNLVTGDMLKPDGIVIDVGTNRVDGKLVGDVDQASASGVAGHLTPVPGGVGPVTVAMLLKNTLELAKRRVK